VRRTSKIAAVAAGWLTVAFATWGVTGCSATDPGSQQSSFTACAEYGLRAIEHHVTVIAVPAPCKGLSRTDLNEAVAVAISQAVSGTRAERRRRAAEVAPYLDHLISGPPAATAAPPGPAWTAPGGAAAVARSGRDLALDVAALIAWLCAAGSGAYVLTGWLWHGGALTILLVLLAALGPASL
jgi:hypothetical protein